MSLLCAGAARLAVFWWRLVAFEQQCARSDKVKGRNQ
jgi:hypothetical protein